MIPGSRNDLQQIGFQDIQSGLVCVSQLVVEVLQERVVQAVLSIFQVFCPAPAKLSEVERP